MSAAKRPDEVTRLLRQWSDGDQAALEQLMESVYKELRKIAQNHLKQERRDHTLQPTALVNELYMKLAGQKRMDWKNRKQFYAVASRMMRRLLIDYARERRAKRRHAILVTLTEDQVPAQESAVDLIELDNALTKLENEYPRESRVVELRYFCGMTLEETADCLDVSTGTVKRDWRFARNWLFSEMRHKDA